MRAREPDRQGAVVRDGIASAYEVFGEGGSPTVLLLPTWAIAHSLHWKANVPALARHHRVITMDGRGNGRSDAPTDPAAYDRLELIADVIAVLDDTSTDRAVIAGLSQGGGLAAGVAALHPDRVLGAVMIAPFIPLLVPNLPERSMHSFDAVEDDPQGWGLFTEHVWKTDFERFTDFFWRQVCSEPHSTKQIEDAIAWSAGTSGEVLTATVRAPLLDWSREEVVARLQRITCPTLVIQGTDDHITPVAAGEVIAEVTGGDLLLIEGGGHLPQAREPVLVNRALLAFVDRVTPREERRPRRTSWTRALSRPKKVLYLSSPIGLGHARRDLAIARELRRLHEDVEVEWLTQHPVTAFLESAGETVHPASQHLVNESAHLEGEAHEHDLHAFQAIRRMDEILVSNFSVLQEIVDGGHHDLVVGDEAWDADHFWHENPELKRTAFAWMTDFVGWLPMEDGGADEAALTADYNAEMLEHVGRFARIRDRSIFVGDPDDIVPDTFGPGLPSIRELDRTALRVLRLHHRLRRRRPRRPGGPARGARLPDRRPGGRRHGGRLGRR